MINTFLNKIDRLGVYIFLFAPFIFFVGYFNGVEFVSFPIIFSILGIASVALLTARKTSTKNYNFAVSDLLVFALVSFFLLTALFSDYPLLSLKRWVLIIVIGASFYFVGRFIPNPSVYLRKSYLFCSVSILTLLCFAMMIYIFGQRHFDLNSYDLPSHIPIWSDLVLLFPDIYVGQTYGNRIVGNFSFARPSSLFSNPNGLALFAMLAFAISWLNWDKQSRWRYLVMLSIITILLWTASRSAILGVLVFILSYQLCTSSKLRRFLPLVIIIVIALPIFLYIYSLLYPPSGRWVNYFELIELRERGSGWKAALEHFSWGTLLTGSGFGLAQEALLGPTDFVFSIWIVLWLETGIVGVILVFLVWTISLYRCSSSLQKCKEGTQSQRINAVLFSLLLALLFHQAFDLSAFRLHPLNFFIFSLLGLAVNPKTISESSS